VATGGEALAREKQQAGPSVTNVCKSITKKEASSAARQKIGETLTKITA
jgi:hypothetical protein